MAIRVWRFGIAILGTVAGLLGVSVGLILLVIHLSGLMSMGVPYLAPFQSAEDGAVVRHRLARDKFRNPRLHPEDRRNQR